MWTHLSHAVLLLATIRLAESANVEDLDQFTYNLNGSTSPNIQYPPSEWKYLRCDNVDDCVGWPEKWEQAIGWELTTNDCLWCPADGSSCDFLHHQSPINLLRNTALNETENYHECIDLHLMKTYDSSCNFTELVKYDAFTVERHALQVRQPMVEYEENKFHVACEMGRAKTHRWGRIDFSRGYPEWWFLSHIDFHVPSEHTLEGTRFDAEMQMQHFYSTANSSTGLDNEMATVAIFLQVFNETDSHDYYMLNKIICQWRRHEDGNGTNATRRLHEDFNQDVNPRRKSWTAHDLFVHNHRRTRINASFIPATIQLKPHDFEEPEDDWEEIVQEVYRREEEMKHGRHLMDYESVGPYHTYFGMHGVKTEYYYRYSGSQTIPPCYGTYQEGSRKGTNHWRIMKDPIKVTQRQIDEMHRLLKERIAPIDDLIRPCQPDTAAGVYDGDDTKVNVSRPLMQTTGAHYQTFCECQDWKSHWQEDQDWCELDQMTRYYAQPYNYVTDGF